jgi:carboxyl-terminal processing protease
MNTSIKAILGIAFTVIIAAVGFIGGWVVAHGADPAQRLATSVSSEASTTAMLTKIAEVDELLQSSALKPPSETSATAGAVAGMLEAAGDKYAMYFDQTHYAAFSEHTMGTFGGIGVVLGENKQGQTYVVEVYKDTPALKVGIKAGDIFHSIDGTTHAKWSQEEVVRLVRGPEGTKVRLTMTRPSKDVSKPGTEVPFVITRAKITYPNSKTKMYGKVGYVRLAEFNANASSDIEAAINETTKRGAKALIVDLRDNPGGLLDQAVDVSSLFVQDGVIVRVDQRGRDEEVHYSTGHFVTDMPLVLLVDSESASASEIVAGALHDYNRATLVGQKTYGKGSVQTISRLRDGSAVKFTIAHYLTPKKTAIDGVGLVPDVVVPMDPMKQLEEKTDTQLAKAISVAKSKIK